MVLEERRKAPHFFNTWKQFGSPTHARAFPCHDIPCYAVHKEVVNDSPTWKQQGGHCCPSREVNPQIRHAKYPGDSDFPAFSLAFAPSLSLACGGERSASGNMISSMIQRLAKNAPSHSHGDDMAQQSTAHVFFSLGIAVASEGVYCARKTSTTCMRLARLQYTMHSPFPRASRFDFTLPRSAEPTKQQSSLPGLYHWPQRPTTDPLLPYLPGSCQIGWRRAGPSTKDPVGLVPCTPQSRLGARGARLPEEQLARDIQHWQSCR